MRHELDRLGFTGTTLAGKYSVDEAIARGGFGVVHRGWHRELDVPIAIKFLTIAPHTPRSLALNVIARFLQEGRLQYRLSREHRAMVQTIDCGTAFAPTTGARVPYLIMEWLDGRTLASVIAEARRSGATTGPSIADAMALLDDAAAGLAAAHNVGVVHRDVKPRNIFVVRDDAGVERTRLLDLGSAKLLERTTVGIVPSIHTSHDATVLSPAYAAPEQFDPAYGPLGPETDVYSLAIVMMELLRLEPLMTGAHIGEYAARHCATERPQPSALGLDLPPAVEDVLARAVGLNARDRWADVGVFWGTLKHAVQTASREEPSGIRVRDFEYVLSDETIESECLWAGRVS